MSFKSVLETEQQASRFKTRIIIGQLILMIIMSFGWSAAPSDITIHYPPDLRSGGSMKVGQIADSEVYLFAQYITQQLNNWKKDGSKDYLSNINKLSAYFTPSYKAYLLQDYKARKSRGELRNRVRNWSPTPGASYKDAYVQPLGKGWLVWLDVDIKEYVDGGMVKNVRFKQPIRVVRYDVNRELNPWGIALNGPGDYQPQLIINKKTSEFSK